MLVAQGEIIHSEFKHTKHTVWMSVLWWNHFGRKESKQNACLFNNREIKNYVISIAITYSWLESHVVVTVDTQAKRTCQNPKCWDECVCARAVAAISDRWFVNWTENLFKLDLWHLIKINKFYEKVWQNYDNGFVSTLLFWMACNSNTKNF